MAKAKKLPSGNWRVKAYCNGINKSFTASTKKEAELKAAEWQLSGVYEKRNSPRLYDAIDEFIKIKSLVLSPSSTATYRKYQRNYYKSIMNIPVDKITKIQIEKEISEMAKRLSPKTISSAITFCIEVIAYFTGKRITVQLPQQVKTIYNTPDAETLKQIIISSRNTDMELPVLLAAWLGMRESEIRGLKWDKVSEGQIIIDTALVTVDGKSIEKSTKTTDSTRVLPLPEYIYNLIKKQPHNGEYIVNMTASVLQKRFKKLLKENDIPDCRFHDLRHANASIMLMLNVPEKYAMERGGWNNNNTLQKIYQQTFNSEKLRIASVIDSFFTEKIL